MHHVWFVLLEHYVLLDAAGAMQVLACASELAAQIGHPDAYGMRVFSRTAGTLDSSSGIALQTLALPQRTRRAVGTLFIVGGDAVSVQEGGATQAWLGHWIARHRARIERIACVGAAAWLTARLGLSEAPMSASAPAPMILDAAGVMAGVRIALDMVGHDLGAEHAQRIARGIVPAQPLRPHAPPCASGLLSGEILDHRVADLNRWVSQHVSQPHTVKSLANRLVMTPRTFARHYVRATGMTPARAVECIRLEAACRLVASTLLPCKAIARQCGFSSQEVMRRSFLRVMSTSPSDYRRRFKHSR